MKINDDLIVQWEPKIQRMLSNLFIIGMEKDDIAQELRIATIYESNSGDNMLPTEILKALEDPYDYEADVAVNDLLENNSLTPNEKLFIQLRLYGLTMEEITEDLEESAYKVRQILREKFVDLAEDYDIHI